MFREWGRYMEPGSNPPVEFFSLLKYVPARWAKWKRTAASLRNAQRTLYGTLVERCKAHISEDNRKGVGLEKLIDEGAWIDQASFR